jgi:hypothetical protein
VKYFAALFTAQRPAALQQVTPGRHGEISTIRRSEGFLRLSPH